MIDCEKKVAAFSKIGAIIGFWYTNLPWIQTVYSTYGNKKGLCGWIGYNMWATLFLCGTFVWSAKTATLARFKMRVTLCASLAQLSFTQIVISFSTWQAEQKKLGKEDVCICCTVSQTYGKRRGNCCVCLPCCVCMLHTDISGDVDTSANVTQLHCCVFSQTFGLLQYLTGDMLMVLVYVEDLTGGAGREKAERAGQRHTKPGQFIREIGASNCRLHRLKPETPVWSAGLCHIPDNRHCAVSVSWCVCVCLWRGH